MTNKEHILRDLEYINGGITTLKALCKNEEKNACYYSLFDEWQDIISNVLDMIEEDYSDAKKS